MAEPTDSTWDLVAEQPDPFEPLANIDRRVYCMSWRTAVRLFDDAVVNPALWDPDTLREIVRRVEDQYKASWARRQAIWEEILPVQDGDKSWDGWDGHTDELKRALQERAEYRDGLGSLHQYLRGRILAAEAQRVPANAMEADAPFSQGEEKPVAGVVPETVDDGRHSHGSGSESPLLDLLQRVLDERPQPITLEKWAKDHHFGRSTVFDWKAAGGKPVPGKVSSAKNDAIANAIKQDAIKLELLTDSGT